MRSRDDVQGYAPARLQPDVHKRHEENVWIRAHGRLDLNPLDVAFAVPARPGSARFADLMEVQRQVGMTQVHRHLRVPHSDAFVLNAISLSLDSRQARSREATHGRAVAVVHSVQSVQQRARSADQHFTLSTADGQSARGKSSATFLPRPVYERLRASSKGPSADTLSAVQLPTNTWVLPSEPNDPLLSDHQSDHMSAMAIVSGIEGVIRAQFRADLLRTLSLRFTSYVEAGPAPTLALVWNTPEEFSGRILQGDSVRAELVGGLFAAADGDA